MHVQCETRNCARSSFKHRGKYETLCLNDIDRACLNTSGFNKPDIDRGERNRCLTRVSRRE